MLAGCDDSPPTCLSAFSVSWTYPAENIGSLLWFPTQSSAVSITTLPSSSATLKQAILEVVLPQMGSSFPQFFPNKAFKFYPLAHRSVHCGTTTESRKARLPLPPWEPLNHRRRLTLHKVPRLLTHQRSGLIDPHVHQRLTKLPRDIAAANSVTSENAIVSSFSNIWVQTFAARTACSTISPM